MTCTSDVLGDIALLILEGEMDLYTSALLKTEFVKQKDAGFRRFIVDCSAVTYLDSSGIGVLISVFSTAHRMKAGFFLCGVNGSVQAVIELSKLTGFLPIVETREDATEALMGNTGTSRTGSGHGGGKGILQDDGHALLEKKGMFHKDFYLDLKKVRYLSQLIIQKSPAEIRDFNLLEQQISELIKNGVRHGNLNDPNKKISIWFRFSPDYAHLIVEDEGPGFQNIEAWNLFYEQKRIAFEKHDFEKMMEYVSYRTDKSTEEDGGNALFAAVEFWSEGVVFNSRGNCVGVARRYSS